MITVDDVIDIAPELSTVDTARIDRFIARASTMISAEVFGPRTDLALSYLTAHLLTLSKRGGVGAGPVTSESVGAISRSYAVSAGSDYGSFGTTPYGIQYMEIRRANVVTPIVI